MVHPADINFETANKPLPLDLGDAVIVLSSGCCDASMTGVEYGDHQACRSCGATNRQWVPHFAVITEHGGGFTGPEWSTKVPSPVDPKIAAQRTFFWG